MSFRRDIVIAVCTRCHRTLQFDDIFVTSYNPNDVINDVIKTSVQPVQPCTGHSQLICQGLPHLAHCAKRTVKDSLTQTAMYSILKKYCTGPSQRIQFFNPPQVLVLNNEIRGINF